MRKENSQELVVLFGVFFIGPFLLGILLYWLSAPLKKWLRLIYQAGYFWILVLGFIVLALLLEISGHFLSTWLHNILAASSFAVLWESPLFSAIPQKLLPVLEGYLKLTVLCSPIVAWVIIPKIRQLSKQEAPGRKRFQRQEQFKPGLFEECRHSQKGAFFGFDKQTRAPVYISKQEMGMHTQVVGATGFGKTASVLLSRIDYDLRNGHGMVFVDGKGDLESYFQLLALVKKYGREKDFHVFSPVIKRISQRWNPLIRGTPTEIKDRLIGSQIWSEEFYKKKGEEVILTLLNAFADLKVTASFKKLERILEDPDYDFCQGKKFTSAEVEQKFKRYQERFKADVKNYGGLASDISLISSSDFGKLFEVEPGAGIDLLEAYQKNQIIYFHLPVLGLEESAKRIGRMVIHDLKTVCAHIQTTTIADKRHFFPVYIDEFASFAGINFTELLNKARSAGVAITILHQSLGDLQSISDNFAKQIFENTNCKIILHIDDPQTIETYCKMIGTQSTVKYTYQTERNLLMRQKSGGASSREVEEFIVHPNEFRSLQVGHGVIYIKSSGRVHRVKLDYLNPDISPYTNIPFAEPRLALPESVVSTELDAENAGTPQLKLADLFPS